MSASELRQKSVEELKQELESLHREQFNLRMQRGIGHEPRSDQIKKLRRSIARVLTILGEKRREVAR